VQQAAEPDRLGGEVRAGQVGTGRRRVHRLAGAAIITYQILLAAIILIRPEITPTHKPVSEYAIGRLGWIAVLAFLVAAAAYALLFVAVRPLVRGRLGLSLLGICVLGTAGVGVFVADPVVTPWSAMTTAGRLHVICGVSALCSCRSRRC
jgi:drug/metabolite transporter (DMT)-like permease